jgi:hypothetical protein
MIFDWYLVTNQTEFLAAELVSREVELLLEGIGLKTVLVTRGQFVSITYEGVMLSIGLTDANPFVFEGHAVYLDSATGDIYLGIEVEE